MGDAENPDWLTNEFLEKLIKDDQNGESFEVQVIKFDTKSALSKGNNYMSNIVRIHVHYKKIFQGHTENDELKLIAKIPLLNDDMKTLNNSGVIEKEIAAYSDVLPKLNAIIAEYGDEPVTPKFFKCDVEKLLIFEDLNAKGFILMDRKEQLDFDHALVTLRNLAKFHAASARLNETEPETVKTIGKHLILADDMSNEMREVLDPFMGVSHVENTCSELAKRPGTEKYVEFLSKIKPKTWEYYISALKFCEDEFNTLNHGDAWMCNMLFRHDQDGNVNYVKLLDFQMIRYGCPASDVIYFLFSSMKFEVIATQYHELTDAYFEYINHYLEKYGCQNRFDRDSYTKSLEKRQLFGMLHILLSLPFLHVDSSDVPDNIGVAKNADKDPMAVYKRNPLYMDKMLKFLEYFSQKDWFKNFVF